MGMAAVGQRIVVVGTGGMGRETAAWIADVGRADELDGFLDDDPASHGTTVAGQPVLGGLDWLDSQDAEVVVAIGTPATRAALVARLDAADIPLAAIVHPAATIGPRTTIGPGAIVCPGVLLTCDVHVGRAAIVNYGAMVGHDGRLGDSCFIAPGVHLAGNVTVGQQADIGIGASVIQGVTIGERAVVGAGAVVIRDVAPDTTVVGVPARPLGEGR
jgi:sugar O-acyltransferase (sialic acid O-acetyltransferase NeuD family)